MTPSRQQDDKKNCRIHLSVVVGALALFSCSNFPHQALQKQGLLTQQTLTGLPFQHALFWPTKTRQSDASGLHIYIEGDGRPWRTPKQIAPDPTAIKAPMLQAMLADPHRAVLLGRPCYYQVADASCEGRWWTSHRYSTEVVGSMATLVEHLAQKHLTAQEPLWLIGHSGGGTLAVLIGARLQRPVTVVTLAANLDTVAWAEHHGFSPLFGSLNPLTDNPRNRHLREMHWYGSSDNNVHAAWSLHYCAQRRVDCVAYDGDHTSWLEHWPTLLQRSQAHFSPVLPVDQNSQRMPAE